MNDQEFKSPLHKMVCTSETDLWNDSCSIQELSYAIEHGAAGATSNPIIAGEVLHKDMHLWKDRIKEIISEMPAATEDDITWKVVEEISVKAAELLMPVFDREQGRKGRLSIQTDPRFYRDAERIVQQAVHFDSLAPNIIVKIPVTRAGIAAIEEATYRGISINATVCFSVPQSLAVTEPHYLEWAGVAAMKKAYGIYKQRGYRLRLLSAATRNHMHWSEFIGGDV